MNPPKTGHGQPRGSPRALPFRYSSPPPCSLAAREALSTKLASTIFSSLLLLAGCAMTPHPALPPPKRVQVSQWTFRVDPAVWKGHPVVLAKCAGDLQTVAFTVKTIEPEPRTLDSRTYTDAASIRYVLPAVDRDTSASLTVIPANAREPLFVWNVLLRPRRGTLIDYPGQPDLLPPDDFDVYWARAKKELEAVPLNTRVARVLDKDTTTGLLYRVELPTVRDTRIVCWYYVPRAAFSPHGDVIRRFPAIIVMPGYGAEEPPLDRTRDEWITLSVNPRNHGPSKEFWQSPVDHLAYNLDDPENYYYKLAYLDCLRGAQFLFSRPEVDTARVAAEGGSQGGLFAIALAALEPRIACVCSNVTAFSDYPDGMALSRIGHHTQFRERLAAATPEDAGKIRLSLRYTDGASMVTRVHCPVQINMAGQDPVCPYVCGIVMYNRIPAGVPKDYTIVPDAKHEVPEPMRDSNRRWYRRWLKVE